MALTCGFFNSVDGDRKYDATQFASLFDGVITDGVVAAVGDFFATTPGGGMVVNVGSGRAWFNRTWTYSDAKIPLTLDASDLLYDRIDAVVLEVDTSVAVRDNSIKVVKGVSAQDPVKPTLTNEGDIHQHALSYIRVKAGSIEIGAADITINVGQTDCPFVTSIVETPELEVLFAQWDAQFTEWFENVQGQLEGDIAANLQKQIDQHWADTLKEDTKELLGLSKESIPDDAFKVLEKRDTFEVGDVLTTMKVSMGDNWALCNGARVPRSEYPELSSFVDRLPKGTAKVHIQTGNGTSPNTFGYQSCVGNKYLAITLHDSSDSASYMFDPMLYIIDVEQNRGIGNKVLWKRPNTNARRNRVYGVNYLEGAWVASSTYSNSDSSYAPLTAKISYTKDANPYTGTWNTISLWSAGQYASRSASATITKVEVTENEFVVAGITHADSTHGSVMFGKASKSTPEAWSQMSIIDFTTSNDNDTSTVRSINYSNGYIIISGIYYNPGSSYFIAYARSPFTSFTIKKVQDWYDRILFFENKWYYFINYSIYTSDELGKNVTRLPDIQPRTNILDVIYANGYFILCGYPTDSNNRVPRYLISKDLTSFSYVDRSADTNQSANSYNDVFYSSNAYFEGYVFTGTREIGGSRYAFVDIFDTSTIELPKISLSDLTYTYIKLKEAET